MHFGNRTDFKQCCGLPGPARAATPNPKTAGPRPSFPSNAHACTITWLTTIIYAMIFRTSVKTFSSISYTNFSLDWQQLFTQWSFALVSKHSLVYHIRISPSQNCRFFTFFTVDFLSLRRCKTSDNMAASFPVWKRFFDLNFSSTTTEHWRHYIFCITARPAA